ncbi:MAG: EamA family transporter [Candidatus Electrothrix sp. GW3-4]|uniref:EamA family transporter n=1 Tax=Candidatus Electrothrix sp. GW3-4 TaxID=3126740 RepID=UPI002B29D30C|nr:MAG: EamA family transporter [Candidatus Electrothrix sp. GW3-3]
MSPLKKYLILFAPVIFSTVAQLLLKQAALKEWKSTAWLLTMGSSVVVYGLALALYSVALRYFPVSLASPVNTIACMLLVILGGTFFWNEPFGIRQALGTLLGVLSMLLILS